MSPTSSKQHRIPAPSGRAGRRCRRDRSRPVLRIRGLDGARRSRGRHARARREHGAARDPRRRRHLPLRRAAGRAARASRSLASTGAASVSSTTSRSTRCPRRSAGSPPETSPPSAGRCSRSSVGGAHEPVLAINEIVVRARDVNVVRLRVDVDGDLLGAFDADGVVVATATGTRRPSATQLGLEGREVLDDAVVDHRELAGDVRVGVDVGRAAVGRPAGVADRRGRLGQRVQVELLDQVGQLAGLLGGREPAVRADQRDARGVVAAVLQTAADPPARRPGGDRWLPGYRRNRRFHTWPRVYRGASDGPRAGPRAQSSRATVAHPGHALRRPRSRRLDAAVRLHPAAADRRRRRAPRRPGRPHRPGRGRRRLPADLPAARPAHRGDPRAARGVEHVPARGRRRHPVRHRGGRLRRGRQVHHRTPAARAARPLARDPPRPAGHHGRLPLPERRAAAPRPDGAQGLPRVVRPARAAAVRLQGQGRPARGPRAGVRPPDVRHPARAARSW